MRASWKRPSRSNDAPRRRAPWGLGVALLGLAAPALAAPALAAGLVADGAPVPGAVRATDRVRPADGSLRDEGELARDMARLVAQWGARGPIQRTPARLLHRGERRRLPLPAEALGAPAGCVTVAVLGAHDVSFVLQTGTDAVSRRAWPVASRAGLAEVTRCGPRKASLRELTVHMRSPRGILESVVHLSADSPPPARSFLASRQLGPALPPASIGPRPRLAPVKERAGRLERAAKRAGASRVVHTALTSDGAGRGTLPLRLDPGCHRLDVLAEGDASGGTDVDARLVDLHGDEPLPEDVSESGQASLSVCVGRAERLSLVYTGTPGRSDVMVTVASWPLPESLPEAWGPLARARLAGALGRELLGSLQGGPIQTSLGVQGVTRLPLEVEPGACYAVAVAALRGAGTSFALGVRTDAVHRENHTREDTGGVALSFCAEGATAGNVEVHAGGFGVAWVLGVWQTAPAITSAGHGELDG